MAETLTPWQLHALVLTERVNSCASILCILFVMVTYLFAPGFDKPINRLIFFASFGNLGSNIAAIISEAGPDAGNDTALCQFQAFLVQMFLGVDCYWALFMAINVYLIFFRDYTVERLRSLDIFYLLLSYGLSFIPALTFIFINTPSRGRMYGGAIIWCWITTEWDFMRVVFLYGIVWVAIALAFIIYGMTVKVIYDQREHLDGYLNPLNENPFANVTTEVKITHEERPIVDDAGPQGISDTVAAEHDVYAVQVEAEPTRPENVHHLPEALRLREITRQAAERAKNQEAWIYARVAFLFFLVLLITWVPTSVNRVYALVLPKSFNFALNYVASFVFPLQAFWNGIVYIITSQTAVRTLSHNVFIEPFRSSNRQSARHGGKHDNRNIYPTRGKQRLRSFSSCSDQGQDDLELRNVSKH